MKKILYILIAISLLFLAAGENTFDNSVEYYGENYSYGMPKADGIVKGSCMRFNSVEEANGFILLKNAEKVFEEKGEFFDCEYYYSNEIYSYVVVDGKKVNIHLSKGDEIKIGVPFIFGSF